MNNYFFDKHPHKYKPLHELAKDEVYETIKTLTIDQKQAFETMVNSQNGNVFLTGSAGTGKSRVISCVIDYLRRVEGKHVIVTATTCMAARLLSAVTVHNLFNFQPSILINEKGNPTVHAPKAVCNADVIITDEISMMPCNVFISVYHSILKANKIRSKNKKPPIRWIILGDMCQLPPVITEIDKQILEKRLGYDIGMGFPFITPEWDLCNFKVCELTEVVRQNDSDFILNLNKIRTGEDAKCTNWFNEHCSVGYNPNAISLYPYTHQVKTENNKYLESLDGEILSFKAELQGNINPSKIEQMGLDYELKLKKGCKVLIRCNPHRGATWCSIGALDSKDFIKYFCNGSLGILRDVGVESDEREYLLVDLIENGMLLKLYKKTFDIYEYIDDNGVLKKVRSGNSFRTFPLVLGKALSIHRSQGLTVHSLNLNATSCFTPGMLYVGLSRVKGGPKNIFLQDFIRPEDAIVADEVKEFYRKIQK